MKSALKLALALLVVVSCSPSDEQIKKKISQQKKKIGNIEKKISKLEEKLQDTTETKVLTPVKIQELSLQEFNHFVDLTGDVDVKERAIISPEMGGQIKKIHVVEGQYVNKGDLLVSLNTDVTVYSIQQVEANLELAEVTYEKQKALWDQEIGSEIQYLQAKANKESAAAQLEVLKSQLDMAKIVAPFSGYVDAIIAKEGELGSPGAPIMQIVNLNNIEINAEVSEAYLPVLKKGDMVDVSFPTYPDLKLKAKIVQTSNVINRANRTFKITMNLQNPGGKLKPNMVAVVRINDYNLKEALVIPSIVIKKDLKQEFVFITDKNEENELIAKKVYVETGRSYDDKTVVTKGLEAGQQVIVQGYNTVANGVNIRIEK